jgi:hypothetical protein
MFAKVGQSNGPSLPFKSASTPYGLMRKRKTCRMKTRTSSHSGGYGMGFLWRMPPAHVVCNQNDEYIY